MTLCGTAPMTFGKFYGLFQRYWNYTSQRKILYSDLEVFVSTLLIYEKLLEERKKNDCCVKELKWICYALDYNEPMLDPSLFVNDEWSYLNHVKKCYYLKI